MPIREAPVDEYLHGLRPERDEVLAEMEALGERDGIPIVEWETGRLLATLVRALAPRRIVEVGTAIGVSALHMGRELPDGGRLITLERDGERIARARDFLGRAGVADRVEIVEGDALETLPSLEGPFDLAFLDATKDQSSTYLEILEPQLVPGALLVVDNLLMSGEAAYTPPGGGRWAQSSLEAGRALSRRLLASEEWLGSVLPVGDGVGVFARAR